MMTIVAWLLLGLVAGYIASRMVGVGWKGLFMDLLLGVTGAILGGALFHFLDELDFAGFNIQSVFIAIVGSSVVLATYHAVASDRQ